jgi:hypothetical protein
MVNCEVKLEKGKSSNKLYFDKKLRQFTNAVKRCGELWSIHKSQDACRQQREN